MHVTVRHDDCWLVTDTRPRRLRSADTATLVVSWTRTNLSDRAFGVEGLRLWNSQSSDPQSQAFHTVCLDSRWGRFLFEQ